VLWKISDADWDDVLATHSGGTFRFTLARLSRNFARSSMAASST